MNQQQANQIKEALSNIIDVTGSICAVIDYVPYVIGKGTETVYIRSGVSDDVTVLAPERLNDGDYDEYGHVTRAFERSLMFLEGIKARRIEADTYDKLVNGEIAMSGRA